MAIARDHLAKRTKETRVKVIKVICSAWGRLLPSLIIHSSVWLDESRPNSSGLSSAGDKGVNGGVKLCAGQERDR